MTSPNQASKGDQQTGSSVEAPNPDEVNKFHRYDDTDNAPESHHHTLGIDANQAAPGPHRHNGRDSAVLNAGTVTGSRASGTALSNLLSVLNSAGIIVDATSA